MKYQDYLYSEHWTKRKIEFKSKTHNRCFICRVKNIPFDVHHKRYYRDGQSILFSEKHTDLRLLCRRCHTTLHRLSLDKDFASNKIKRRTLRDIILQN